MKTRIFLRVLLAATISLLSGAVIRAQAPTSGRTDALQINTRLVSLIVSVTDKEGRHFTGLEHSAFSVFEEGIRQAITFFGVDDGPASVGIVFDLSGSMQGAKTAQAKAALAHLVQTGHWDDEYFLVAFNDQTRVLLEGVREGAALTRAVAPIIPRGHTALYDAVATAITQVKQGRWEKRALIIISDGADNRSRTTLKKLRELVLEAGVTVYAVLTEAHNLPRAFGAAELRSLAAHSGGAAFTPRSAERMPEVFEQIALELRQRYTLGYEPTSALADGRWRGLKVKVAAPAGAPRLVVKTRAGYYVTAVASQRAGRVLTATN